MNSILIIFSSATTVARVKKQLRLKKFQARITQTPKSLSLDGCTFAIITEYDALGAVIDISKRLGVAIKAVYEIVGDSYKLIEQKR